VGLVKLFVIFLYIFSATSLWALKIPKSVYRFADMDKARQEAADKKMPVCIVSSFAKLKPT
jgi:hypothetical protein